jgi:hypothetical protein
MKNELFSDGNTNKSKKHFKSTINLDLLNEIQKYDETLSRKDFDKVLGLHYIIDEKKVTIYNIYCFIKETKEETKYTYGASPVIEFSLFKKFKVNLIDTFADDIKINQVYYQIQTIKDKYLLNESNFYDNLLKFIKDNKVTNTNLITLKDFFMISTLFENLLEIEQNWTTEYCFYHNQHLCPENDWHIIKKRFTKKLGLIYELVEDIYLDYQRNSKLHLINYEKNEIEEIIKLYNLLPMSLEESKVYKILLSSAVSNWFTYFLKSKGYYERKEFALIGLKGNRKSFIGFNTFGLFNLINCYDKSSFIRENNINADLKNMYPICLPQYIDEIPGFSEQTKQRLKDKANGDRTNFTKNNMEGGKDWHFDNGYTCFTANNIELSGDDFDDKQFTYEPKKIMDIPKNEIFIKSEELTKQILTNFTNSTTNSSKKLGKYIYDNLLKINPETFFSKLKICITREDKQFNNILFGSLILEELGILKNVPVDKTLFFSQKLSNNSNTESDLDKLKTYTDSLISMCEFNTHCSFNELKIQIKGFYMDDNAQKLYKLLNNSGIYLRNLKGEVEIVITSLYLQKIKYIAKTRFRDRFRYNTLKNLSELFEYKIHKPSGTFYIDNKNKFSQKKLTGYAIKFETLYDELEISENDTFELPKENINSLNVKIEEMDVFNEVKK